MDNQSEALSPPQPEEQAATETRAVLPVAVGKTVTVLQSQYLGQHGERSAASARGTLAKLRRQAGQRPETDPVSLQRVLLTLQPTLTEEEIGRGDALSHSEEAAFHALTLFALHMQGASTPAHQQGVSFASACGRLYALSDSQSMKPRFDALLLARHSRSQLIHARSMVTLLRGNSLKFDYGAFARDLRNLAHPSRRAGVLLRWGRDFAMAPYATRKDGDSPSETTTTTIAV